MFYLYFLTNINNKVLYTGVTSDLQFRVIQHKEKFQKGFTDKYNCNKLVYYEEYENREEAIMREKQIKNWTRKKKDFLINKDNSNWNDLSEEWS